MRDLSDCVVPSRKSGCGWDGRPTVEASSGVSDGCQVNWGWKQIHRSKAVTLAKSRRMRLVYRRMAPGF